MKKCFEWTAICIMMALGLTACGEENRSPADPSTTITILPNDNRITYSDHAVVTVDANKARFSRQTVDGQGLEHTSPGARVRFNIEGATEMQLNLQYTALVTKQDTYNGVGVVLVDGIAVKLVNSSQPAGIPESITVTVPLSPELHAVDFIMPYCASMDFISLVVPRIATVTAAAARPSIRCVIAGDSITQGFYESRIDLTWAYLFGIGKNWQIINHGYGRRTCIGADGTTVGNMNPDIVIYLIGYNDFSQQIPLAYFKSMYKSFINNLRAVKPNIKIYCITPTYSTNTKTLTLEDYRQQIRDTLSEINDPLNVLIEGVPLTGYDSTKFQDNIHPNNVGAALITTNLLSQVGL